jgi:hypothetical protein
MPDKLKTDEGTDRQTDRQTNAEGKIDMSPQQFWRNNDDVMSGIDIHILGFRFS